MTKLKLCLFVFNCILFFNLSAQGIYSLGNSGAQLYFESEPQPFMVGEKEDGSNVYTMEAQTDSLTQGVIYVELASYHSDETDQMLILKQVMQSLKKVYTLENTNDVRKKPKLITDERHYPNMQGISEVWGARGEDYQIYVHGWVDKAHVVVLYTYGQQALLFQRTFFQSFRLPI
jgi:hypothetical protein